MPKNHFQFKQFGINQEGATLKVCTDSCLFGAWAATVASGNRVLDIGTGTGLLALMYAQEHPDATVIGLEIDPQSAELAKTNFIQSPWRERMMAKAGSLQDFSVATTDRFDTIICNPPFFENQLLSQLDKKNMAKHSAGMRQEDLVAGISCLLIETGTVCVLLPPVEGNFFIDLAKREGFYLSSLCKVKSHERDVPFRYMMELQKKEKPLHEEEIVIYEKDRNYTAQFTALLKGYYLYL